MATAHPSGVFSDPLELIAAERVSVGDFVMLGRTLHPTKSACVLAKHPYSNDRTSRIVGWLVDLADGERVWLARGATLQRRRV